jgi:hypothetical protein
MSYAVWVKLPGEPPATNACRFATIDEADRAGWELLSRWFAPETFEVRYSDDAVNYEFPADIARPRSIK